MTPQQKFDAYRKSIKRKTFKLKPSQIAMIKEGMPLFLIIPQEERRRVWEENPPKAMPVFMDRQDKPEGEDTKRFREWFEARETNKSREKLEAFKASRPARPKREPRPSNTFSLAELALSDKADPRIYRRAARNIKAALAPLQVQKYVYNNGNKDRIRTFIQQEIKRWTDQKSKASSERSPRTSPKQPSKSPKRSSLKSTGAKAKSTSSPKASKVKEPSTLAKKTGRSTGGKQNPTLSKKRK